MLPTLDIDEPAAIGRHRIRTPASAERIHGIPADTVRRRLRRRLGLKFR